MMIHPPKREGPGLRDAFAAVLSIGLLFCPPQASAELLDPQSPSHALLDPLVKELDAEGIDILRKWSVGSPPPGERPVLAPLRDFASEVNSARAAWMRDFKGDVQNVLVGAREDGPAPSPSPKQVGPKTSASATPEDLAEFRRAWDRAPESQRVFISFTRADAPYAQIVKRSLESRGYRTFIFVEGAKLSPNVAAAEAGHFFSTAGNHVVIDTKAARRSSGVWYEKVLLGRFGGPPTDVVAKTPQERPATIPTRRPVTIPTRPTAPRTIVTGCTCNTYRNGVLISSVRIPVGARCGAQVCR